MNKFFRIVLLCLCLTGLAEINIYAQQQNHFVYIQSDDKIPFDVNVNGKTYNSSSIGYVIIPKLAKGTYQLSISFPNKKYPDQQFNCQIDKSDAGYALKNYGDKGWGLFNLQSLDITMAGSAATAVLTPLPADVNKNAFGEMLSEVANDSTLTMKTEPVKLEAQSASVTSDTLAINNVATQKETTDLVPGNTTEKKNAAASLPVVVSVNNVNDSPAGIHKIGEFSTKDGTDLVFIDRSSGLNDTIRVFLPMPPDTIGKKTDASVAQQNVAGEKDSIVMQKEEVTERKDATTSTDTATNEIKNPFYTKDDSKKDATGITSANAAVVVAGNEAAKSTEQPFVPGSDCKALLSESDMNKLRKKMVSADSDEKMIGVVRKSIADKCMSTEQVKSLSALFLSDDGRYNFFNSVLPFVYDTGALSSLEGQLIDPAYKKRFQALLK